MGFKYFTVVLMSAAVLSGCQTWQPNELAAPSAIASPGGSGIVEARPYGLGYRTGFFDGAQRHAFTPRYPPRDEDQDGIYDNWETYHGLDPDNPADAVTDADDDLLTALDEFWLGSSPVNPDTDGDGIPDGVEFAYKLDPRDPEDARQDLDNDGVTNLKEYLRGSNLDDNANALPRVVAGSVAISWTAPSTRVDGASIGPDELESYEIHYGNRPDRLNKTVTVDGDRTSTTITDLPRGTWYFAIRVIDDTGMASQLSEMAEYRVY